MSEDARDVGASGPLGGWRTVAFAGGVVALGTLGWYLLPDGKQPAAQVQQAAAPTTGSGWVQPRDAPAPETQQVRNSPPPTLPGESGPVAVRRARPSPMSVYVDPNPPSRPAPVVRAAAGPAEPDKPFTIAGMTALRAEMLPDPEYWIMPGDKIACITLEPLSNPRTGTPFSATVPEGVRGRVGNKVLIPPHSRLVGTIVADMERGEQRIAAVMTHVEWPSRAGQGTPVVALRSAAGDQMGTTGLTGNAGGDFFSRFASVAAYALLDTMVQTGGAIGASALQNSLRGDDGRGGTNVNINASPIQGAARSLSGAEYDQQSRRQPPFNRPQGQPCTVFVQSPLDFRGMRHLIP